MKLRQRQSRRIWTAHQRRLVQPSAPGIVRRIWDLLCCLLRCEEEELAPEARSRRLVLIGMGLSVFAMVTGWRLYSLQGTEHLKWRGIASKQHHTRIEIQGARGEVVDAFGRALAVSVPAIAVGVHPQRIDDPQQSALRLATVLGEGAKEIEAKLRSEKRFVWLARGMPERKREELGELKIDAVEVFDEFRRHYPQGSLAGSLIGTVGVDGAGLSGIELQFNGPLSAPGYNLSVRRDARGRLVTASAWEEHAGAFSALFQNLRLVVNPLEQAVFEEEAPMMQPAALRHEGKPVVLTIDSVVQGIVEAEFAKGREESKAARVFGVVMDADSGELLAMAQSPGSDPNRQTKIDPDALRNFVLQDGFEPGSTMKPLVAAGALDQKLVGLNEIFNCENGRYQVGRYVVKDVHPVGVVPFPDVLIRSSNVCMAKIGQRLGKKRLHQLLQRFGFGAPTAVGLSGESGGILRPAENWADIDVATHSFGQGVSVTAMQLVKAYAALANGGRLVRPTILKRSEQEQAQAAPVFSRQTAERISSILRQVTEDEHGTGNNARIAGIAVQGKTGTAQKARKDGRGYDPDNIIASFVGYVDGSSIGVDHRLVMIVIVDEPRVQPRWGGVLAAPVFRRSMERILSHMMTRDGHEMQTAAARRLAGELG